MVLDSDENALRASQAASRLIAEYAVLERRLDLMNRYNEAVGPPSASVARVQSDFIKDRMEPGEIVAFVGVCQSLIFAVNLRRS